MNNVIILGKVVSKSTIHFDYLDKLKAYFKISVLEDENIFEVIVSERYIETSLIDELYSGVLVNDIVCVYGRINNFRDRYIFVCNNMVCL